MQRYVEQPALTHFAHPWYAGDGPRVEFAVRSHDAQPPRPLGHEHAAIGQEGEAPRMFEPLREGHEAYGLQLCPYHALRGGRVCNRDPSHDRGKQVSRNSIHRTASRIDKMFTLGIAGSREFPARLRHGYTSRALEHPMIQNLPVNEEHDELPADRPRRRAPCRDLPADRLYRHDSRA
jgi:hypothetical protein